MRWRTLLTLTTVSCLGWVSPDVAHACGGCFAPITSSAEQSFVTGHRMAFAVNETRTVLWDQFQYTGSPEDFSWVLPVRPGAYIEASTDAWFEALEAVTATRVVAEQLNCAGGSGGGRLSCGGSNALSDSAGGGFLAPPTVQVVHEGTVGPYDTVTLRSTNPDALRNWLTTHDYAIPLEVDPIIDAYVTEGWDFLALRLSPGRGINQMTPVRIVTPDGDPMLPLRMVAAGAASNVAITLYVIGEGRYGMPDLPETGIDANDLVWDWSASESNFGALRTAALEENDGKTYLTSFAVERPFTREFQQPDTGVQVVFPVLDNQFSPPTRFAEVYFDQAWVNENGDFQPNHACRVVDSAFTAGAPVREADPGGAHPGGVESHVFGCGEWDDIEAAMIGMVPRHVWISRLEMNLPRTALGADCVVERAEDQDEVEPWLLATEHDNPPCDPSLFASTTRNPVAVPVTFAFAIALLPIRRRRKPRA